MTLIRCLWKLLFWTYKTCRWTISTRSLKTQTIWLRSYKLSNRQSLTRISIILKSAMVASYRKRNKLQVSQLNLQARTRPVLRSSTTYLTSNHHPTKHPSPRTSGTTILTLLSSINLVRLQRTSGPTITKFVCHLWMSRRWHHLWLWMRNQPILMRRRKRKTYGTLTRSRGSHLTNPFQSKNP